MSRKLLVWSFGIFVVLIAGIVGYLYFFGDTSFYSKHVITFEDLKEKEYNGDTFMAVLYDPSCSMCQKAEPVFENMSKEHDIPFFTVNTLTIDKQTDDIVLGERYGTPTFLYFVDGNLTMRIEGYHPKEVYDDGMLEVERMLKGYNEKKGEKGGG